MDCDDVLVALQVNGRSCWATAYDLASGARARSRDHAVTDRQHALRQAIGLLEVRLEWNEAGEVEGVRWPSVARAESHRDRPPV